MGGGETPADSPRISNPAVRLTTVLSAGSSLTLILILIVVSVGPLQRIEDLTLLASPSKKTLEDFLASPADIVIINQIKALDADAKAILDGAGPKEKITTGRQWAVGDVVYVGEWEWVDAVYPHGRREDPAMIDKCGIEPPGKLTIRGFSEKRESALLEYTTSNSGAGTPCNSGVYFFYPVE